MEKYDRENLDLYSNLLDEIKQNFNLDNEGAEAALLLIRERALSLELSLSEYMRTYHSQGFSEKDNFLNDEYKGYIRFIGDDAASIIKTGKTADFSTFTHEIAHGFRRQLSGELKETAEKAFKVENGQWTHVQEEAFAVGFEEYIRLRLTENEELEKVFEKGSLYMQRVYNGLDRIIELNPEIIKVYDQMFTHGRFQFNQEEFDKTIDKIANFKDETSKFSSSHVYLGMTPPIYQELGFERLPVMITAKHLQNIMAENGKSANINYHGITPDMIKQIPEAIKKPLIVMQSQNKGNEEDIIAVIGLKDKKGKQIIIPFSPNKKGYFNDLEIDINLAKTIYGRTGFNDFLMRSIKEDRILYVNEKSRELTIPEIQFLRNRKSQLLYNNIAEYHKAVKEKNPDFNILYQKQAYYSGGQFEFDFLNDPEKKKEQKVQEKPIQAKFEFMVAEKKSDFFGTKSTGNGKTIELKKIQSEINAIETMKIKAILQTYTNTDYLNVKIPFAKGFFINDSVVYDETPALKKEIESLKRFIISKNNPEYDTRYFMQKMGVCNGFLCATDGKVLKRIKLAGLEQLENRSCVKVEYKDRKIIIRYDDEQKKLKNAYPPAANIIPEGKTVIKFNNEKVKKIIQNLEAWDILKPQPKREHNWDKNILPLEVKEQGIYIGNEKIGIAENTSQDKFFIKINYLHLKNTLSNEKNTIFRLDDHKKTEINGDNYYTDILHQETKYSSTIIKLMERNIKVPEIFNSKELSTFLNTKTPGHKKIENSIER